MTDEPSGAARRVDPFLPPDETARREARRLAGEARHGALATLDAADGLPLATRVALAREPGGDVLLLLSDLSDHTKALRAHPVASLLLGEVGEGDPLASARLTLRCDAARIEAGGTEHEAARTRFLARLPRAALYADFGDFAFWRLRVRSGLLNGGFARAYRLTRDDLCREVASDLLGREAAVIRHMNEDHADSLDAILRHARGQSGSGWSLVTLDPLGFEAQRGEGLVRVDFARAVETPGDYRDAFVHLAREADRSEAREKDPPQGL